mgnify:CR=1 FL=1
MARSVWKGPFVDLHLLKKAEAAQDAGQRAAPIKTWSRRSTILPQFVGLTFGVYNGKKHIPVNVIARMLGFPLEDADLFRGFVHDVLEGVNHDPAVRMAAFAADAADETPRASMIAAPQTLGSAPCFFT